MSKKERKKLCVNALHRAYPISTWRKEKNEKIFKGTCQCPTSGLSHFYAVEFKNRIESDVCVNALHRAYPISTMRLEKSIMIEWCVSMPYIGLIPFLLMNNINIIMETVECQCPTSGLSHFYALKRFYVTVIFACQCPTSGLSHFYRTL